MTQKTSVTVNVYKSLEGNLVLQAAGLETDWNTTTQVPLLTLELPLRDNSPQSSAASCHPADCYELLCKLDAATQGAVGVLMSRLFELGFVAGQSKSPITIAA
jgi:hypothetical protein